MVAGRLPRPDPPQPLDCALLARRFALIAERVELLRPDPRERVGILLRDERLAVNALDVQLVAAAEALDLVCGYALRRLRRSGAGSAALLDVLAQLPPTHLLGVFYALPLTRQRYVRRTDGAWAYYVARVERAMPAALGEVDELARTLDGRACARIVAGLPAAAQTSLEQLDRATLNLDGATDALVQEVEKPDERLLALLHDEIRGAARRAASRWREERRRPQGAR